MTSINHMPLDLISTRLQQVTVGVLLGYTNAEIQRALDISASTVKSALQRARDALADGAPWRQTIVALVNREDITLHLIEAHNLVTLHTTEAQWRGWYINQARQGRVSLSLTDDAVQRIATSMMVKHPRDGEHPKSLEELDVGDRVYLHYRDDREEAYITHTTKTYLFVDERKFRRNATQGRKVGTRWHGMRYEGGKPAGSEIGGKCVLQCAATLDRQEAIAAVRAAWTKASASDFAELTLDELQGLVPRLASSLQRSE